MRAEMKCSNRAWWLTAEQHSAICVPLVLATPRLQRPLHRSWWGWWLSVRVAAQEFNIEKLQLLESEKAKIRKEYERREAQVEVKKKMCAARGPAAGLCQGASSLAEKLA